MPADVLLLLSGLALLAFVGHVKAQSRGEGEVSVFYASGQKGDECFRIERGAIA
jgi:hypothetical protein